MTAQLKREGEWYTPERESGVRACVRQEEIDTLPPPPPDLEDVHARATVNRKLSPEFLSYLRSFDAPRAPEVDPVVPEPWVEPLDDTPILEIHEELDESFEEESREAGPGEAPAQIDLSSLHDEEEVPSFRDHRASVVLVGLALVIVAAVAALLVT